MSTSPNPAPAADPDGPDDGDATAGGERRRRIAFVVGGLLVAAGIAVAVWALVPAPAVDPGAATSPTVSPSTTSPSPSPPSSSSVAPTAPGTTAPSTAASEPAAPVDPAPAAARIVDFSVDPTTALCPDDRASTVPLRFSWRTESATQAWIGRGTTDASAQPTAEVPVEAADYAEVAYECRDAEQLFTLSVRGADGETVSASVTVSRVLQ